MIRVTSIALLFLLTGCGAAWRPLPPDELARTPIIALRSEYAAAHERGRPLTGMGEWSSVDEYRRALRARAAEQLLGVTEEERAAVAAGKIARGFTSDLVWWAWGPPDHVDANRSPWGTSERWWYGHDDVSIQDGVVTWWNQER